MYLKQYRGEGWPILGDFAVGFLKSSGGPRLDFHRDDGHMSLEVNTSVGGFYTWYRFW